MFELNQLRPRANSPQSSTSTANEVELQSDGSYIQWRYKGFARWNNLISVKALKGDTGKDGKNGKDGLPGAEGKDGAQGLPGLPGKDGERGKPGKDGAPGVDGLPGINGLDGREIELQKSATHIQWRYVGDTEWQNVVLLEDLKGPKGDPGENGKDGKDGARGPQGYPGASASAVSTFETVSKNIKAWAAVFAYTDGRLTTITYTKNDSTILKTLNYTGEKLTSIVLSGNTPSGIELTKTLSYTGDQLTGTNYA